ncbi:TetR/AcrR family transcriptional regulator [Actinocorallia longicatena]|uniref:HTH tetR-type domain-containing protein n=1 Tax=Actinocorallia longicatena TaxID=111803 RepID=A0ABP6Q5T9_9ACTN
MSAENAAENATLAERAVRRRVAGVETTSQADVAALMEAGLTLMVEHEGRRAPRVADIVAAAGMSNDSFYRYFAGKDALVAAIVEQGARNFAGYVRHRVEAERLPERRIRAGVRAVLRQATDTAFAARTRTVLANGANLAPENTHVSVTLVDALTDLFTGPAAELGAADPAHAARTVAGAALAAMQYHLFKGDVPDERELEALVAFLLAGVAGPAGR